MPEAKPGAQGPAFVGATFRGEKSASEKKSMTAEESSFEFGGRLSHHHFLGRTFNPLLGTLDTLGNHTGFRGVWTRSGAGGVRSVDVAGHVGIHETGGFRSGSGDLTLGLNTADYRMSLAMGSKPATLVPGMARFGVERLPFFLDDNGYWQWGWDARLAYFRTDELASLRSFGGERAPNHHVGAGAGLTLSLERPMGKSGYLSHRSMVGLDAIARLMPHGGAFTKNFKAGHGTTFPLDTLGGIGGVHLAMDTVLQQDMALGSLKLLRTMLSHELRMDWADPTIAPHLSRNALSAGLRLFTPGGLSFSAAGEVDMRPDLASNFAFHPSMVLTTDAYSPGRELRFASHLHVDGEGVRKVGANLEWTINDHATLGLYGAHDRHRGTSGTLGVTIPLAGGPRSSPRSRYVPNPLLNNVDPTAPFFRFPGGGPSLSAPGPL